MMFDHRVAPELVQALENHITQAISMREFSNEEAQTWK